MSRLGRTVSPLPSYSVTVCLCLVLVSVMVKVTGGVASAPMDPDTLLHCHQDQECRPIVSCPPVLDLVRDVKNDAATSPWRLNIVHVVRDRICGHVAKRKVCCPKKHLKQEYLSSFQSYHYNVTGDVYMLDSQTLVIRNFTYEGTAPDAFLIAGVSTAEPSGDPDLVLQFPFEGEHLGYHDTRVNVFKRFDGQRDLVITLPQHVKADM